jgi:hypothetical protein
MYWRSELRHPVASIVPHPIHRGFASSQPRWVALLDGTAVGDIPQGRWRSRLANPVGQL